MGSHRPIYVMAIASDDEGGRFLEALVSGGLFRRFRNGILPPTEIPAGDLFRRCDFVRFLRPK